MPEASSNSVIENSEDEDRDGGSIFLISLDEKVIIGKVQYNKI